MLKHCKLKYCKPCSIEEMMFVFLFGELCFFRDKFQEYKTEVKLFNQLCDFDVFMDLSDIGKRIIQSISKNILENQSHFREIIG
jgi:hypothetical protein